MTATAPTGYVVRVAGHLDAHREAWFEAWQLTRESDGTTTLTSTSADQAQLHGLLGGVRDLGAILLSVSPASPEDVKG